MMIVLFYTRLKDTKSVLSQDAYERTFETAYHKDEALFTNKERVIKYFIYESIIFALCYGYVLFKNYGFLINILSVIQIITIFMTVHYQITDIIETDNIKAIYHKNYLLFNVGLDYVYYPIVIFTLLFH